MESVHNETVLMTFEEQQEWCAIQGFSCSDKDATTEILRSLFQNWFTVVVYLILWPINKKLTNRSEFQVIWKKLCCSSTYWWEIIRLVSESFPCVVWSNKIWFIVQLQQCGTSLMYSQNTVYKCWLAPSAWENGKLNDLRLQTWNTMTPADFKVKYLLAFLSELIRASMIWREHLLSSPACTDTI